MSSEQKQKRSLKRRARWAENQKSKKQSPEGKANMIAKLCHSPIRHDLNVAHAAVALSLKDKLKKQQPPMPIYTLNADENENIALNSIFLKHPKRTKITDQKTAFRNWEVDHIGANISANLIIRPTRANPFYILCDVAEIVAIDGVMLVGSGRHAVLLCATKVAVQNMVLCGKTSDILNDISSFKPNIKTGNKHFNSAGKCFSFGDHGAYEKLTDSGKSSVRQYSSKDNVKETHYGTILSVLLNSACDAIDKRLPYFSSVSALTTEVIMKELNQELLTGLPSHQSKYLSAHFNFNARTEIFHIERDVTYTLIFVPSGFNQTASGLQFQFRLNDFTTIIIGMGSGVTFTYAAW
eukprot:CAMPEP_0172438154 /NCGR_PEP_ID=MMETSP1064-20121228/72646_1 /TAXON_ID=202472 /ORGANISM="Aulacoseira subarctica , Strain CCAP 1002/5" /LENGTH=351 /DNA_ID=CAMNT_0013186689 /DNA_START=699 /DNA_END=1751 /DNA_ORIENTATION=-